MNLDIKNFRAIKQASLPIDGHLFVAGPNGSGKTSISMALAAAFSGSAAPWDDVKAKDARKLLNEDAQRGSVTVTVGEQSVNVNYPGGSVSGQIDVTASPVALGLASVATMKPAEATTVLAGYMGATPTLDDLREAIGAAADQVWPVIESGGWDAALSRAKESGSRLKGQWEGVTGENYGSQKAKHWKPDGAESYNLSGDLDGAVREASDRLQALQSQQAIGNDRIERLQNSVTKGQQAAQWLSQNGIDPEVMTQERYAARLAELRQLSAKASAQSAEQARISDLKRKAGELDQWQTKLQQAQSELAQATTDVDAALKHLNELPKPSDTVLTAPCPSCGTHLVVVSRTALSLPDSNLSQEENLARSEAVSQATVAFNAAKTKQAQLTASVSHINTMIQVSERAASDVSELPADTETVNIDSVVSEINLLSEAAERLLFVREMTPAAQELEQISKQSFASPQEIEAAQHALNDAQHAVSIKQAIEHAQKLESQIAKNATIVAALEPAGVRQTVLMRALENFNAMLEQVCKAAHWGTVSVSDTLQITYAGRAYGWQLSESEKFRARVALQLVMASIDGSALVVIDAADIMDSRGRNGLFTLIKDASRPVVVTMTMNKKTDVPDLSKIGVKTFWINPETGTAEPVHFN